MDVFTEFVLLLFLRAVIAGFIVCLPLVGPLAVLSGAAVSLWAWSADPALFAYIFMEGFDLSSVFVGEDAAEGLFLTLAFAGGVGLWLGWGAGSSFQKAVNRYAGDWFRSLRDWIRSINWPKLPRLRR